MRICRQCKVAGCCVPCGDCDFEPDKGSYCCVIMAEAIDNSHEKQERSRAQLPGIQQAHLFNTKTCAPTQSPVIYCMPGKGRGKKRIQTKNIIIPFCPFCGTKLDQNFK